MQFLVVVGFIVSSCHSLEMARIHIPHGQDLTSSTLQWVDLHKGQTAPENAVRVSQDGPLWCRAKQRGTFTAGSVQNGKCRFPFLGQVNEVDQYDVLVSINGSARIISEDWDRLQAIPDRGIATPQMLLAVDVNEQGETLPGYVSFQERRAYILDGDKAQRQEKATILTEDEPILYHVNRVVKNEEKSSTNRNEETVAETTLINPGKSVELVSDTLDFTIKEMLYWGRIRGTITGLDATVMDPSGNERDITWGIENEFKRLDQQMVSYELPGEASVDVTLIAVMHKYEAPYSAKLTSSYRDGAKREHPISGLHIHTHLAELRADFSQPYFTANKTEVPGEYIPSEVLIHSTTTTTTTTTHAPSSSSSPDGDTPQSDSLATTDGGQARPKAEHMSGANSASVSLALSIISLALLMVNRHEFLSIH